MLCVCPARPSRPAASPLTRQVGLDAGGLAVDPLIELVQGHGVLRTQSRWCVAKVRGTLHPPRRGRCARESSRRRHRRRHTPTPIQRPDPATQPCCTHLHPADEVGVGDEAHRLLLQRIVQELAHGLRQGGFRSWRGRVESEAGGRGWAWGAPNTHLLRKACAPTCTPAASASAAAAHLGVVVGVQLAAGVVAAGVHLVLPVGQPACWLGCAHRMLGFLRVGQDSRCDVCAGSAGAPSALAAHCRWSCTPGKLSTPASPAVVHGQLHGGAAVLQVAVQLVLQELQTKQWNNSLEASVNGELSR